MACDVYYLENVKSGSRKPPRLGNGHCDRGAQGSTKVRTLADLVKPGIRVAVGEPDQCTIGALTRRCWPRKDSTSHSSRNKNSRTKSWSKNRRLHCWCPMSSPPRRCRRGLHHRREGESGHGGRRADRLDAEFGRPTDQHRQDQPPQVPAATVVRESRQLAARIRERRLPVSLKKNSEEDRRAPRPVSSMSENAPPESRPELGTPRTPQSVACRTAVLRRRGDDRRDLRPADRVDARRGRDVHGHADLARCGAFVRPALTALTDNPIVAALADRKIQYSIWLSSFPARCPPYCRCWSRSRWAT